jgi:hypothetical protein
MDINYDFYKRLIKKSIKCNNYEDFNKYIIPSRNFISYINNDDIFLLIKCLDRYNNYITLEIISGYDKNGITNKYNNMIISYNFIECKYRNHTSLFNFQINDIYFNFDDIINDLSYIFNNIKL